MNQMLLKISKLPSSRKEFTHCRLKNILIVRIMRKSGQV